jgi:hypothetical protein
MSVLVVAYYALAFTLGCAQEDRDENGSTLMPISEAASPDAQVLAAKQRQLLAYLSNGSEQVGDLITMTFAFYDGATRADSALSGHSVGGAGAQVPFRTPSYYQSLAAAFRVQDLETSSFEVKLLSQTSAYVISFPVQRSPIITRWEKSAIGEWRAASVYVNASTEVIARLRREGT